MDIFATMEGPAEGPVIMLHTSLGCTHRMWDPQIPGLLDTGFRVLRYDYRGHGRSAQVDGTWTLTELGQDALAVMAAHGVATAAHAGLSLGGMVAMWLAEQVPDSVQSLVLCCTSAQLEPAQAWRERGDLVRAKGTAAVADLLLPRWLTAAYAAAHPGDVKWLRDQILSTSATGYAGCCDAIAAMDLLDSLRTITAPTLVVAGAQDPATPVEHAKVIAAGIPGAALTVLQPGAHLLNVERPRIVTRLIIGHLRAADDRSQGSTAAAGPQLARDTTWESE
jgi:3-oxoadipate enol-lactonase